ncbi:MAG: RluA family pseudouridine synthase [Myxococcales bacterium]|nr:RluA family pseudouridine synthase [Myxococcales bacterium]
MSWTERFEVGPNCEGWRLDNFLTHKLKRASRAKVARIIKGGVRLESGKKVKAGTVVRAGDVVIVERVERGDPGAPGFEAIRVLCEGATAVVLDKPAGMLVHRTAHEATRTLDVYLAERFPGERVEPVHRLDRDTSGVLLCGRGLDAIRAFTAAFEAAEPQKRYRALAVDPAGEWPVGARRTFDTPLGSDGTSEVQIRVGPGDKPCATHAVCVARAGDVAELEVRIERGRQHQIRAHLSMFGTPIVGDKLYGMGDAFFQEWILDPGAPDLVAQLERRWHCLHAEALTVELDGASRTFDAGPPPWSLQRG